MHGAKIRQLRLRQVRISVEVLEAGGARQGAEREIEIPYAMDCDEFLQSTMTAAAEEIDFLKLKKKGMTWKT